MQWSNDSWLSGQTDQPVFKIEAGIDDSPDSMQELVDQHPQMFCYSKVSTEDTILVETLTKSGFYVVDVNLLFSYTPSDSVEVPENSCKIRLCTKEDQDDVLSVAESSFRYSRFHLDSHFTKTVADKIKREWIQNYILGKRGEALWVVEFERNVAGFLAVITSQWNNQDCAIIDLIGVRQSAQGKGVGTSLVQFFQQEYGKQYPTLLVGTQAANIPSVRLYEKLGFHLCDSKYVLHYHK